MDPKIPTVTVTLEGPPPALADIIKCIARKCEERGWGAVGVNEAYTALPDGRKRQALAIAVPNRADAEAAFRSCLTNGASMEVV